MPTMINSQQQLTSVKNLPLVCGVVMTGLLTACGVLSWKAPGRAVDACIACQRCDDLTMSARNLASG